MTQSQHRAQRFQLLPPESHHVDTMRAAIYSYGDRWIFDGRGNLVKGGTIVEKWTETALAVTVWNVPIW